MIFKWLKHRLKGKGVCTDTYRARLAICTGCPKFHCELDRNGFWAAFCKGCGCGKWMESELRERAKYKDPDVCPMGKWAQLSVGGAPTPISSLPTRKPTPEELHQMRLEARRSQRP